MKKIFIIIFALLLGMIFSSQDNAFALTTPSLIIPPPPSLSGVEFVAKDSSDNIYANDFYGIKKTSPNGTQLLEFGSFGSDNGQFSSIQGIAVDSSGNIYVVDHDTNRVQKFNSAGTFQGWIGNCNSGTKCDVINHVTTGFCNDCTVGSSGSGNGQFWNPHGIALDSSENIYVADTRNSRVEKFNSSGVYQSKFGSNGEGDGQFTAPYGIAIDSSDHIYVSDSGRVQKFSHTGTFIFLLGSGGTGNGQYLTPRGIALDNSDNIYLVDTYNGRAEKFDSSGAFQGWIGNCKSGTKCDIINHVTTGFCNDCTIDVSANAHGNGQFFLPEGIVIDSLGNIYVVDGYSRVEKFNSLGVFQFQLGSAGSSNGKFFDPVGIALDPSGNIYVVDLNNNRVQKFNSSGTFQGWIGNCTSGTHCNQINNVTTGFCNDCTTDSDFFQSGSGQFYQPASITLDQLGNIYVVDSSNDRLERFNSSGVYYSQIGSTGTSNGKFNHPLGVEHDSSNNIYVADQGNNRVEKFNSAGTFQGWIGNCNSGTYCDVINHVTTRFCFDCIIGSFGSGNGQFALLTDNALDISGNIYVADLNNNRVQKFNSSGTFQGWIGNCNSGTHCDAINHVTTGFCFDCSVDGDIFQSGNGQFYQPASITLDQLGNIYVMDYQNDRVEKFNPSGVFQSQFGTLGSNKGEFDTPHEIAIDSSGNIYAVDSGNNRIQKFGNIPICSPPLSGDWILTSSCTMSSSATAPANVIINNGIVLTIPNSVILTIHFTTNHILVHSGGGVQVKSGGKIN